MGKIRIQCLYVVMAVCFVEGGEGGRDILHLYAIMMVIIQNVIISNNNNNVCSCVRSFRELHIRQLTFKPSTHLSLPSVIDQPPSWVDINAWLDLSYQDTFSYLSLNSVSPAMRYSPHLSHLHLRIAVPLPMLSPWRVLSASAGVAPMFSQPVLHLSFCLP